MKTNIVTAVEIADDAGDSPMFKPLVDTTAENFTVKEVPADKAYLSHDNLALVEKLGGTAYVPFKSNSQPGEAGQPVADHVPLLPVPTGRIPDALPPAEQRGIDLQRGQDEVPGRGAEQDGRP